MNFKEFYSTNIAKIVLEESNNNSNQIYILQGQNEMFDLGMLDYDSIVDISTIYNNGNEAIFSKTWFTNVFLELNKVKPYHIISFQQFSYLIHYIDFDFFKDRFVLVKDNIRQVFPIKVDEYTETETNENIEERSEKLPIYQSEQFKSNDNYFYVLKNFNDEIKTFNIFNEELKLNIDNNQDCEIVDIHSGDYAIDIFINEVILNNNLNKQFSVKLFSKKPISEFTNTTLKKVNALLSNFKGIISLTEDTNTFDDYKVSDETLTLLKTFWSDEANFRNLTIYKNPELNNETIEISQGLIVDTLIKEYKKSKNGLIPKDLFLTAPTGAGKSLLFQIPSFYISNNKDVTIVVSPLIALMEDQVQAIKKDRNFEKVAYLNSNLSLIDREKIIESCKIGEIDILYLSPELLMSYDIRHFIGERNLGLMVIDEAHLITTWGRDFRVDYWFLGNHIRKIRKYNNMNFPMIAVTATAIYGGENDMVFDSIDSLNMNDPHIFIGQARRNDITFVINNYEKFTDNYKKNKLYQTVDFIKKASELEIKTLVYAPYTKHVKQINTVLSGDDAKMAVGYYGAMDKDLKRFSFDLFKTGERKVMVSTKAFGMGVDISDIQLVYHHAPSGLLPDYIQEIGRAARRNDLMGYAALNYSSQDQSYSKALHGMSAIRQYQLKEVLKKIVSTYYKNNKSRNLLLSIDDFGYIFENAQSLDQKVLTSLMMLEKDYLAKNRFNVLIARPKKLFVDVFAKIKNEDLIKLQNNFPGCSKTIKKLNNGFCIIELNLDKIWKLKFNFMSFPFLKSLYFKGELFKGYNFEVIPQLKISYENSKEIKNIYNELSNLFEKIKQIFSSIASRFFTPEEFKKELNFHLNDDLKAEKITNFILSTYSGKLLDNNQIEPNSFLQHKRLFTQDKYKVFSKQYIHTFSSILKKFNEIFNNDDVNECFVTNKESSTVNFVRLGYFLDLLDLGTFEIKGGENAMIFLRINDPSRIEFDSKNNNYNNTLLNKTLDRYHISNQIFDHFFLRSFSNDERWDFVEDYFLGENVDNLLSKFNGGDENKIEIINFLKKKNPKINKEKKKILSEIYFEPNPNKIYNQFDNLTLEKNDVKITSQIFDWINQDPILLDQTIIELKLRVDKKVYSILDSKIKTLHQEYYKKKIGLNVLIDFKCYKEKVLASIPFKEKPVDFYNWWRKNQDEVYLSYGNKINLLNKVHSINPSALLEKDKNILLKK